MPGVSHPAGCRTRRLVASRSPGNRCDCIVAWLVQGASALVQLACHSAHQQQQNVQQQQLPLQ